MGWRIQLLRAAALAGLLAVANITCAATTDGPRTKAGGESAMSEKDADNAISAVVRVKVKTISDARTNANLGSSRDGSGVVIDDKGHILTIGYIVIEAESIEVTTQEGRTLPAIVVGYDHATGFGLLRATAPLKVKPLLLGESEKLQVSDPVMILTAGGRETASIAYVVARRPFTGSWEYLLDNAIFTSPPTLEWAGAALINRDGKLVGVGSLLVRDAAEQASPLPGNMFVPVDILKPILADLKRSGRRAGKPRPWIGMATETVQGRLFVTRVSEGGPADRAGIHAGDILLGIGPDAVRNHADLYKRLWAMGPAGVEVSLKVLQGVDIVNLKVKSIDRVTYFKKRPTY